MLLDQNGHCLDKVCTGFAPPKDILNLATQVYLLFPLYLYLYLRLGLSEAALNARHKHRWWWKLYLTELVLPPTSGGPPPPLTHSQTPVSGHHHLARCHTSEPGVGSGSGQSSQAPTPLAQETSPSEAISLDGLYCERSEHRRIMSVTIHISPWSLPHLRANAWQSHLASSPFSCPASRKHVRN